MRIAFETESMTVRRRYKLKIRPLQRDIRLIAVSESVLFEFVKIFVLLSMSSYLNNSYGLILRVGGNGRLTSK